MQTLEVFAEELILDSWQLAVNCAHLGGSYVGRFATHRDK